jgi:hypothetical protein
MGGEPEGVAGLGLGDGHGETVEASGDLREIRADDVDVFVGVVHRSGLSCPSPWIAFGNTIRVMRGGLPPGVGVGWMSAWGSGSRSVPG